MQLHRPLKRFSMEGEVGDDADFPRLRAQFESYVIRGMRDDGYVPILELGPFWSTEYDAAKNKYTFVLSVHGYKVGRRQACEIEGITGAGQMIPRSTVPSKLKSSSIASE